VPASVNSHHSNHDKPTNLLQAAAAALLVLIALFQMDPARAEGTMDIGGYGSLHLNVGDESLKIAAQGSELKMIIDDAHVDLVVKQRFKNERDDFLTGEYVFALPANATVNAWHIRIEQRSACLYGA